MQTRPSSIGVGLAVSVVLGGACLFVQGPLPGDVALAGLLRFFLGDDPGWARALTASARAPMLWPTLLVAMGLAFLRGGPWDGLVPPIALVVVQLADRGLRALVFAPRPEVSGMMGPSTGAGSGLPSTLALVYGALFGAVLFARARRRGRLQAWSGSALAIAAGLIVAGCAARVVLGGHWASQLLASLSLAFTIVLGVQLAIDSMRSMRRDGSAD